MNAAPSPMPTPFDIVEIPKFPFEPPISWWVSLILLTLLFALILKFVIRPRFRRESSIPTTTEILTSLRHSFDSTNGIFKKRELLPVLRLLKRSVSVQLGKDIVPLSERELLNLSAEVGDKERELLRSIARLDGEKFAPGDEISATKEWFDRLLAQIQAVLDTETV